MQKQIPSGILKVKKSKRHIIYTWIVMICFVAGQWAVYAHSHRGSKNLTNWSKSLHNQVSVTEKCQLCDAMHHNSMLQVTHTYFAPFTTTEQFYQQGQYDFVSIALILSAGRAPPVS